MAETKNIFADMPARRDAEEITTLLASPALHIERIVSHGEASPPGFWYDQPQAEWVIVLAGSARLRFEGDDADTPMAAGDYVHIAATAATARIACGRSSAGDGLKCSR